MSPLISQQLKRIKISNFMKYGASTSTLKNTKITYNMLKLAKSFAIADKPFENKDT